MRITVIIERRHGAEACGVLVVAGRAAAMWSVFAGPDGDAVTLFPQTRLDLEILERNDFEIMEAIAMVVEGAPPHGGYVGRV